MALDATVAGATANSYVALAEADAYFADRLNADAWTAAGTKQAAALITATKQIDAAITHLGRPPQPPWPFLGPRDVWPYPYSSYSYLSLYPTYPGAGYRAKVDQALKFPRWWDRDMSGVLAIPKEIKAAVCEQSLFLLEHGADYAKRLALQAQGVTGFQAGQLSEDYVPGAGREVPLAPVARTMLKGYLQKVASLI